MKRERSRRESSVIISEREDDARYAYLQTVIKP